MKKLRANDVIKLNEPQYGCRRAIIEDYYVVNYHALPVDDKGNILAETVLIYEKETQKLEVETLDKVVSLCYNKKADHETKLRQAKQIAKQIGDKRIMGNLIMKSNIEKVIISYVVVGDFGELGTDDVSEYFETYEEAYKALYTIIEDKFDLTSMNGNIGLEFMQNIYIVQHTEFTDIAGNLLNEDREVTILSHELTPMKMARV